MLIWYESQTNHICDGLLNGQIQSAALAWKSLLIFLLEHFPRWLVQSQTPQTPKPPNPGESIGSTYYGCFLKLRYPHEEW